MPAVVRTLRWPLPEPLIEGVRWHPGRGPWPRPTSPRRHAWRCARPRRSSVRSEEPSKSCTWWSGCPHLGGCSSERSARPVRPARVRRAEAHLERMLGRLAAPGVAVEGAVRVGRPWEEILAAAREVEADLVCLGSSGHSRFQRLLLGSTAENLARRPTASSGPRLPARSGRRAGAQSRAALLPGSRTSLPRVLGSRGLRGSGRGHPPAREAPACRPDRALEPYP